MRASQNSRRSSRTLLSFSSICNARKVLASKLYVVRLESAPTAMGKFLSILLDNAEGSSSSSFCFVQNKFTSLLQSRVLKSA